MLRHMIFLHAGHRQEQLMKKQELSHLKGILFIAFFFSLFIMLLGMRQYSQKRLFILSFSFFFAAGVIFDLSAARISPRMRRFLSGEKLSEKINGSCSVRMRKRFLWLLIALSFVPAYLALFPGTFGYDAPVQAAQYFGEMELSGANPLLHTYLLGFFLSFGEKVLKNASLGVALFSLLQGLLVTHVLTKSFVFLEKAHTPFSVIAAGLLWILCNPTLHVLTFNVTKDILLGVCLLHFLLNLLDVFQSCGELPKTARHSSPALAASEKTGILRLLFSGIAMCLMRNAAIYLIAVLIIALLFSFRKYKKAFLSLCMIFLISWLFSRFSTYALHIVPGDARENMSLPIQQLAAVAHSARYDTEPVDITQEQLAAIHELIPAGSLEVFMRDTVDLVKADFDTKTFTGNPRKYISLYLTVGRQNPGIYIRAFRDMTVPYFDMTKSLRRDLCLTATFPEISHLHISGYGLFPSYYNFLEERIGTDHYFLLMQPGISIWLMVIGIGVSINRKDKEIFLCILPPAIYFIGLLLGPMALLRYLYPMMLATPLLFGILFRSPGKIPKPVKPAADSLRL